MKGAWRQILAINHSVDNVPPCGVDRAADLPAPQPARDAPRLPRQLRVWGLGLLLAIAGWLLLRRGTGALARPLGGLELLATALLLILGSAAIHWGWSDGRRGRHLTTRRNHAVALLTSAGVLTVGVALSVPGTSAIALASFWGMLLASEAAWAVALFGRRAARFRLRGAEQDSPPGDTPDGTTVDHSDAITASRRPIEAGDGDPADLDGDERDELLAGDEWQRITRARDSLRGDSISGVVRCSFAPGERQHDVHLAFCPPLRQAPHFSVEQVDGPPARLRASVVEPFGVGLEIKLTSLSSEPASVQFQFFACEEAVSDEWS